MNRPVSALLIAFAGLLVVFETLYFASLRPAYSHVANTISELGETGSPQATLVAYGFFLPVGLLVWLALWLVHKRMNDWDISFAVAALSCLGLGYLIAVFFPCDAGAPLYGSWRTLVHNVAGFFDYEGTGIGFLLFARIFAQQRLKFSAVLLLIAGALVLAGTGLLCLPAAFPFRGAVQRGAEMAQFTGEFLICLRLQGKWAPLVRIQKRNGHC